MIRDRIIEIARAEIGPETRGSAKVYGYWRAVLPKTWSDAQVRLYAKTKAWCGGFALWVYTTAGITEQHWVDSIGFAGPCHLKRTHEPQRGDLGVKEHPFQHHVIFDYADPDGWAHCVAGNTPTVSQQRHRLLEVDWYSIEPLLAKLPPEEALPEAGFVRGQEFSVPGIQDEPEKKA